ncbi:Uma2 family endonuclease [Micromonospora zhanjiangensis]|uniref:Uma2 family endonuclease n=1 Tax=Micromonospora zhanjiangensis TaxID=1522057 RepID=A0ABV8KGF3_9ACTN
MTAAPILPERQEWTVDDLGGLPPDLPYELVNGRLILPSPTALHQDLCVDLVLALRMNCPPDYIISIDQSMSVDRRNEPRPDVVVIRREHADRSPVPVGSVQLAVEVLSPTSIFRDMYDKAKVYAHAGVRAYWVVDPLHGPITLTEYLLSPNGEYEALTHTADLFVTERPWKVSVDLPALTARRAGVLARAGQEHAEG